MFYETLALMGVGAEVIFCLGLTWAALRWASTRPATKVLIAALDRNATATEANTEALERLYDEQKAARIDRSIAEAKAKSTSRGAAPAAIEATNTAAPAQRDTITSPPPEPDEPEPGNDDPTVVSSSFGLPPSPNAAEAPV